MSDKHQHWPGQKVCNQCAPREQGPDCVACKDTGIYLGAECHVCTMSHR